MVGDTPHSLLKRLRESERDDLAWREFVALYTPWLEYWLRCHAHLSTDDETKKDLIQDVLLVVCRRIGEYEHNQRPGAFRAWLRQIVINCLRDERRRRPLRGAGLDGLLADLEDPRGSLRQEWEQDHDAYVLQRLLEMAQGNFSEPHYQAFYRTQLEEKPASEVAEQLNLSVAAVYTVTSRVFRWLREQSQGLVDQPPA